MNIFRKEANEIYAVKTGKKVCTLEDGGRIVMEPGMAAPYSRKVNEWIAAGCPDDTPDMEAVQNIEQNLAASDEEVQKEAVSSIVVPEEESSGWKPEIEASPREELPPFDPVMGVSTPGFRDFCATHKLNENEIAAMVRRLEKRK